MLGQELELELGKVLRMGEVEDWLETGLGQELGKLQGRQLVKELEPVLVKGLGQELETVLEKGLERVLEQVLGMGLVEYIYETKYLYCCMYHFH